MAKTIKEMAHEHVVAYMHNDEYEEMEDTYIAGANAVLEKIENFMKDLDLGNSAEEKFYKLDVLADIGLFIEQLKK